uniref:Sulfhydryl oxidase n=1 Tax=Abalone asfa-like virus TaxID=2839893 RepID=A0A5K7XYI9_9VIRU|nr:p14 homolog protein [Abalone asfa-like virus]
MIIQHPYVNNLRSTLSDDTTLDEWGPEWWRYLHLSIQLFPDQIPEKLQHRIVSWILTFCQSLPCGVCRAHAITYLTKNGINTKNKNELMTWAWRFHNHVNYFLNKPKYSWQNYVKNYNKFK